MKKLLFFLPVAILLFSVSSCKKIVEQFFSPIDVNMPSFQLVIPPVPVVSPSEVSLGSYTVYFNLDSAIKANTRGVFGVSTISTIKVRQMNLEVLNADQQNNLANFETAGISLASNSNTSQANVAAFTFADVYAISASSQIDGAELKNYFAGNELSFTLTGKNRRPTQKALTILVKTTLSVK
ncbi:hypothetical protein EXU57_06185 [Segetibacter sp. 3557_3]|uniref:hypothetical protein n=1 Tax=Segetibacter sp. 3557_3 TaxID=2547429 RepID=UPI0010588961|nr:hypothetical protein [Segetibacter sp. 3557_3]TDH28048.1 hypothetical protein EXU57_06185 [Segetibacter sp. 3557_3]